MNFQAVELARVAQQGNWPGFRWSSIFAGTCVGIAVYVLLMLLAVCAGITKAAEDASFAVLAWNLLSAFTASVLGTFIAARSADLRRASEGAMHGLLVWSCVTVLALLASLCLVRDVGGNVAVLLAQNAERDTALAQNELVPGWKRLRETGTGSYSPDDRPRPALFVVGEVERGVPAPAGRGLDLPAYVALMICAALAISLFGGIAGGLLGTRSPGYLRSLDEADWRVEEERLVASRPR